VQQETEEKLTHARLACPGCQEKVGRLGQLQVQLNALAEQLAGAEGVAAAGNAQLAGLRLRVQQLEEEREQLQGVLRELQAETVVLRVQLFGKGELEKADGVLPPGFHLPGIGLRDSAGSGCGPSYGDEGLLQQCERLQRQVDRQAVEAGQLRDELEECKGQLAAAQAAASRTRTMEQQLQEAQAAAVDVQAARAHAAATAAAQANAEKQVAQLQQQLLQQEQLCGAMKLQLEKLGAQQQLLEQDYGDALRQAAARAEAATVAVAAKDKALAAVGEQKLRAEELERRLMVVEAQLNDAQQQVHNGLHNSGRGGVKEPAELSKGSPMRLLFRLVTGFLWLL
jgi:chromosome segregation ATPase